MIDVLKIAGGILLASFICALVFWIAVGVASANEERREEQLKECLRKADLDTFITSRISCHQQYGEARL